MPIEIGKPAHGDGIDQRHHAGKDGQRRNAVRDHAVDLIRYGHVPGAVLFVHRSRYDLIDVGIALVGDDAFGIVVHFLLAVGNVRPDMRQRLLVQLQLLLHFFIALKQFDRVPAQETFIHTPLDALLDVGDGMFHAAGEHMGKLPCAALPGGRDRQFRRFGCAFALERADGHRPAAQLSAELFQVDLIAVFPHKIDHVDRHHNRDAQFDQLGGQVEIAFDVGAVDDVEDDVRLFADQIGTGDDLLQRVRRKRVDAGKVLDDDVLLPFQAALLLFHRNAGPVADILVGTRQRIEQSGLAAVRVAGQRDLDCHKRLPLFLPCQKLAVS